MNFIYSFFQNPFVQSVSGAFIWAVILFTIAKNKADTADQPFQYAKYSLKNWDNWLLNFLLGFVLVAYMPDVITILNKYTGWELQRHDIYNLGAGVFTELIYVGVALLFGWKKKFIPEGHESAS